MLSTLFLSFPIFASMHLPHFYAPTALLYTLTAVLDFYRAVMHPPRFYTPWPRFQTPTALLCTNRAFIHPDHGSSPTALLYTHRVLYTYRAFICLPHLSASMAILCTYCAFMHLHVPQFYAPTVLLCTHRTYRAWSLVLLVFKLCAPAWTLIWNNRIRPHPHAPIALEV